MMASRSFGVRSRVSLVRFWVLFVLTLLALWLGTRHDVHFPVVQRFITVWPFVLYSVPCFLGGGMKWLLGNPHWCRVVERRWIQLMQVIHVLVVAALAYLCVADALGWQKVQYTPVAGLYWEDYKYLVFGLVMHAWANGVGWRGILLTAAMGFAAPQYFRSRHPTRLQNTLFYKSGQVYARFLPTDAAFGILSVTVIATSMQLGMSYLRSLFHFDTVFAQPRSSSSSSPSLASSPSASSSRTTMTAPHWLLQLLMIHAMAILFTMHVTLAVFVLLLAVDHEDAEQWLESSDPVSGRFSPPTGSQLTTKDKIL